MERRLQPVELGFMINDLLVENFPDIMTTQFTAKMEEQLDEVEDGKTESPDKELLMDSLQEEVSAALDTLKDREREVIRMYFGIEREYALTLNEIGEEFGLTRERVRQIKEKAIRRLRHRSRSRKLRQYLG